MSTILAVWNKGQRGKTQSINAFARHLLSNTNYVVLYASAQNTIPNNPKNDFRLVVNVNGKIIGIESQGDPNTNLQARLNELINKYGCQVIICSTRTSGQTVIAVETIARNNNFNVIWTSTYEISGTNQQNLVNDLKGQHILDLLQQLGII